MTEIVQPLAPSVPPLSAHIFESDRRRAAREEVALETVMADRWGRTFAASILNISQTGMMAETSVILCERDAVRVEVPTIGWMRGDVVWALGERAGIQFRDAITPAAFAAFVSLFGTDPRG